MKRLRTAVAAIGCLLASFAAAEPRVWLIDEDASRLDIVYLINGEERSGLFSRFEGLAVFDPTELEAAELTFTVEMESVDVGDPFGTVVVKTDDWFGAFNHPEGAFNLTSLFPLEEGAHQFVGDLTIKGVKREIEGVLTIEIGADEARAVGRTVFDRSIFKIGVGLTSLFVEVGDEVAVEFEMVAAPRPEE